MTDKDVKDWTCRIQKVEPEADVTHGQGRLIFLTISGVGSVTFHVERREWCLGFGWWPPPYRRTFSGPQWRERMIREAHAALRAKAAARGAK